jgi:hypothetical protein
LKNIQTKSYPKENLDIDEVTEINNSSQNFHSKMNNLSTITNENQNHIEEKRNVFDINLNFCNSNISKKSGNVIASKLNSINSKEYNSFYFKNEDVEDYYFRRFNFTY